MEREHDNEHEPATPPGPPPAYEPPAIIWEESFVPVTMATSCARLPGQNPSCDMSPGT